MSLAASAESWSQREAATRSRSSGDQVNSSGYVSSSRRSGQHNFAILRDFQDSDIHEMFKHLLSNEENHANSQKITAPPRRHKQFFDPAISARPQENQHREREKTATVSASLTKASGWSDSFTGRRDLSVPAFRTLDSSDF